MSAPRGRGTVSSVSRQALTLALAAAGTVSIWVESATAKVSRIVVDKVEPFNDADLSVPYEKLRGRAFGELDPYDPANEIITDLKFAPRNANGKVEYVSVFELTKPVDMTKVEAKVHEIERLRADLRFARIRTVQKAKEQLSADQRQKLEELLADSQFTLFQP